MAHLYCWKCWWMVASRGGILPRYSILNYIILNFINGMQRWQFIEGQYFGICEYFEQIIFSIITILPFLIFFIMHITWTLSREVVRVCPLCYSFNIFEVRSFEPKYRSLISTSLFWIEIMSENPKIWNLPNKISLRNS